MRYLLDTTIVIPILAGGNDTISFVAQLSSEGVGVSILSYLEAY